MLARASWCGESWGISGCCGGGLARRTTRIMRAVIGTGKEAGSRRGRRRGTAQTHTLTADIYPSGHWAVSHSQQPWLHPGQRFHVESPHIIPSPPTTPKYPPASDAAPEAREPSGGDSYFRPSPFSYFTFNDAMRISRLTVLSKTRAPQQMLLLCLLLLPISFPDSLSPRL